MKNIISLVREADDQRYKAQLASFAQAHGLEMTGEGSNPAQVFERLREAEETLYSQFTHRDFEGNKVDPPHIRIEEAMISGDISIALPRVINTILQEPVEPNLFLMNQVAEHVELPWDSPETIEFPAVGTLTAGDVSENGEYPNATLAFTQNMTSLKIKKVGLMASFTEETQKRSMWPMIDLHVRHMARAINRRTEEKCYEGLQRAKVIFDNDSATAALHTTGKSWAAGAETPNGTFSYHDMFKMAGILIQRRYNPTHLLAHPLAWGILATDPILRAQFANGGQIGSNIWATMPKFDQQTNMPLGIAYVPYYAILPRINDTIAAASSLSGLSAATLGDIYMIDSANSLYMVTRGDIRFDNAPDFLRDGRMVKASRFVGVAVKDQGNGMAVAKSVRVDVRNEESALTIRQVTS